MMYIKQPRLSSSPPAAVSSHRRMVALTTTLLLMLLATSASASGHHQRRHLRHHINKNHNNNHINNQDQIHRQTQSAYQSLCIDLSSPLHGSFGHRTISVSQRNAQWLLQYNSSEVSVGSCKTMEQILNDREMKKVSFCKSVYDTSNSSSNNGSEVLRVIEYEMYAPRFMESFLYDKGVRRGECMNAVEEEDEEYNEDGILQLQLSDNNKKDNDDDEGYNEAMVPLCFNLDEYGAQTINVSKKSSKWFLSDDQVVSKGTCRINNYVNNNNSNPSGQIQLLDEREIEMITYCATFGHGNNSNKNTKKQYVYYEYEIKAPRFLMDYLRTRKGVERGECDGVGSSSSNYSNSNNNNDDDKLLQQQSSSKQQQYYLAGTVTCNFVPEYFAFVDESDNLKPNNGNSNNNNNKPSNKDSSRSKKDKPKPKQDDEVMLCSCNDNNNNKPDKVMTASNNNKQSSNSSSSKSKKKKKTKPNSSSSSSKSKKKNKRSKSIKTPKPKLSNISTETSSIDDDVELKLESVPIPPSSPSPQPTTKQPTHPPTEPPIEEDTSCDNCICHGVHDSGFVQIPNTNCKQFVQCYNGCITQELSCGPGLLFDYNLKVCNWEIAGAVCGPDPDCNVDGTSRGGDEDGDGDTLLDEINE